ncbi:TonB-dependent receptor [Phenylobacterium sp. LjRoot219]|uniref:TonB-dependent receptor n=1 Tax=Phenylobacterium sp. LjRoot219 TaxID=3342283 RepID=UPI003ED12CDF
MFSSLGYRRLLIAGACASALGVWAAPAAARADEAVAVDELIVTAERREAALQDVPMAVSAFSAETLRASRLDGPSELFRAIPNTNFSRSNFGTYNLSIRGIGSKFIGLSGEYGVSVHVNATPLTFSRLADAQFFDVERVEVLRGPQGALYGRNATGGAVNVLTVRPTDRFEGSVTAEYGNYDTVRLQGALNLPLNEMMALRLAGFALKRDGFATNTVTGNDIDDRDIQAFRASFRLQPNEVLDLNVMWEHFNEKDSRTRVGKQLCIHDPGPASIGAVPVLGVNRGYLSQGCQPGSRYSPDAYGAVNSLATLAGITLPLIGMAPGDVFAGRVQDPDLRHIEAVRDPLYAVRTNLFQIDAKLRLRPGLTLQSLTAFNYDHAYSYQDYLRVTPSVPFTPVGPAAALFPGGYVDDGQVGRANALRGFDYYPTRSKEFFQEVRLYSNFDGAWDFTLGAAHREFSVDSHYYVLSNGLTAFAKVQNAAAASSGLVPYYVDPAFPPDGTGHNYYDNQSANRMRSSSVYGELIWRPTAALKLTGGLRVTDARKASEPSPITLLAPPTLAATPPASGTRVNPAFNGGRGHPPAPLLTENDTSTTGRLNLEWTPTLGFTDHSMVYASYSRGYKGGGFNTPCDLQSPGCGSVPQTFAPEHVDAFEMGTKNILAGGRLALNLTGFYYNYDGYQVAGTINKSSVNQNIDAQIYGLEFESVWEPVADLQLNLAAGWLKTTIRDGAVIDTFNRTQGDPRLAVMKAQDASNCVVNRAALATLVAIQQGLPGAPAIRGVTGNPGALLAACSGAYSALGLYNYAGTNLVTAPIAVNNAPAANSIVQVGQGVPVSLRGNRLPNAPEWTVSFGAQYSWNVAAWRATLRGDYYRQGDSYARIFNSESDKLKGYPLVNATLSFQGPARDLEVLLYVKNLTDETPITDIYLTDDSSGLFTNTFTLDPRTYGVAVTKRF